MRNQNEVSPATCLNTWKAERHRKILFSLKEEKIRRAQNEKSKEYFSVAWRACRAMAGLASLLGVLLKNVRTSSKKHRQLKTPSLRAIFGCVYKTNGFMQTKMLKRRSNPLFKQSSKNNQ